MPKYTYKPIDAEVHKIYTENSGGIDRTGDFPNGLTAELCVIADSEEEALQIRIMISDIRSWELVKTED